MKILAPLTLAGVVVALLVAPGALAKGASEATITGPGLDSPLTLPGEGQEGGEALLEIAQQTGFFAAVFGQTPDPMRDSRPRGKLGPKYVVRYEMPGPNNELDTLEQELYPYARPAPVSYMRPGQRFWTTERTRGGWYVAPTTLRAMLVAAGLPEAPPTSGGDESSRPVGTLLAVALMVVGAVAAIGVVLRRRPHTRTVTASRSAS
jgi:hypothetical protein